MVDEAGEILGSLKEIDLQCITYDKIDLVRRNKGASETDMQSVDMDQLEPIKQTPLAPTRLQDLGEGTEEDCNFLEGQHCGLVA